MRSWSRFFKSEFGQVGLPAFETFAPVLSEAAGDYSVFSPVMLGRKHAGTQLANPIKSLFGVNQFNKTTEAGFRRIIYLSQLSQTLCIKTLIEEFRRGKNTYGALLWQLNDGVYSLQTVFLSALVLLAIVLPVIDPSLRFLCVPSPSSGHLREHS